MEEGFDQKWRLHLKVKEPYTKTKLFMPLEYFDVQAATHLSAAHSKQVTPAAQESLDIHWRESGRRQQKLDGVAAPQTEA